MSFSLYCSFSFYATMLSTAAVCLNHIVSVLTLWQARHNSSRTPRYSFCDSYKRCFCVCDSYAHCCVRIVWACHPEHDEGHSNQQFLSISKVSAQYSSSGVSYVVLPVNLATFIILVYAHRNACVSPFRLAPPGLEVNYILKRNLVHTSASIH